jgi:outer membrane receptor protein involved in Fe transport
VVVAGQRPERLQRTPRSVELLRHKDVRRKAPRTTPELLEEVAGVVVQKTNHGGGSPFIRGFTGQHVLHLYDGVRLNNSTTRYGPNQALNTVDPFALRRVELLRGPGSLFYGSDAIGGVIYLVGRDAPYRPGGGLRFGGEATARFGSGDLSQAYNLGAWTQIHRVTAFAGGSFKDFNTLRGGRGIGPQRWTGYHEGSWDGAVTVHLDPRWSLKAAVNGMRQRDVPRTDKSGPEDFRYYRRQDRDLAYVKLQGSHGKLLDQLELILSYHGYSEDRDRFRLSRDRIEFEFDRVHTAGLSLVAGTDLGRYSRLTYGVDAYHDWVSSWRRDEAISTGASLTQTAADRRGRFVDGSRYLQGGVFLADTISPLPWLEIRAGGRLAFARADIPADPRASEFGLAGDPIEDTSLGFGGGLSLTFRPLSSLRLVASVHHAFRAPNLDDYSHVGSEGGGFDIPSGDLEPEQATTLEAGVRLAHRWLALEVFGHYTWLHDFIARRYTGEMVEGEPATQRANTAEGYVAGLEAKLSVAFGKGFSLLGWLSWARGDLQDPLRDPATQPIRRMSPLQGYVAVGYRHPAGHWARAGLRWSARQDRLSPGDRNDGRICPDGPDRCEGTPGFAAVHLAGGLRLHEGLHLTLRIENVSNEAYKFHGSGVYAPGLSVVGMLQARY